jgi:hypothetical protein
MNATVNSLSKATSPSPLLPKLFFWKLRFIVRRKRAFKPLLGSLKGLLQALAKGFYLYQGTSMSQSDVIDESNSLANPSY